MRSKNICRTPWRCARPTARPSFPRSEHDRKYYAYGLQRFLEEARVLAKFKERSIVRLSRFLEANGTGYLIMDYEEGESLAERLRGAGVLEEAELCAIAIPILEGLRAVHAKNFLHRDIKPGNIFIRRDGSPVLLDFGAARQVLGEQTRTLTGMVTPGYAPVEQYGARGKQGPWTDLYALGATLYHCVSGKAPVEAPDRIAALQGGEPDPLTPAAEYAARYFRGSCWRSLTGCSPRCLRAARSRPRRCWRACARYPAQRARHPCARTRPCCRRPCWWMPTRWSPNRR